MATPSQNGSARASELVSCEEHGGFPVLCNPILNRGTSFTEDERGGKKLEGLLPPKVETMSIQAKRVRWQLNQQKTSLDKYAYLMQLSATNQHLFYKMLMENLEELLPIVYTPTVGDGCRHFHQLFIQPSGMYLSAFKHRGRFRDILENWPSNDVEIIVVTDGGRILGLGDLGTNGMGISMGKIALYVTGAGFHPEKAMPVCLDCGTNNEELRNDELYLGERQSRLEGTTHMEVVREFCMAVKDKWPHCLIHFEDFRTTEAITILETLREEVFCFNDDIQGTAAVVVAGFLNGMKIQQTSLSDVRIVFCGAGSSAVGVATMLAYLLQTDGGLSREDAFRAIYLVDTEGLVTDSRSTPLKPHKLPFARRDGVANMTDLVEIVRYVKPHALFGLTGGGTKFTQIVVEEMCCHCSQPLIFPLSNPTSQSEVTAENAYRWSKGKCLFASGSPFDPVDYDGKTYISGQANNVLIFPGLGFGAVAVSARKVTDEMLMVAAKTLANYVKQDLLDVGRLYPDISELRSISVSIAREVAKKAQNMRITDITVKFIPAHVIGKIWNYAD